LISPKSIMLHAVFALKSIPLRLHEPYAA